MARPSKYKPSYAKKLRDGLRANGMSIWEVCREFGISEKTYYNWKAEYTSFADACEIGERDYKIFWHRQYIEGLDGSKNGQLLKFAAANNLGWSDKKTVETKTETQIQKIEIEVLAAPEAKALESKVDDNIIDITPVIDEQVTVKPDETSS